MPYIISDFGIVISDLCEEISDFGIVISELCEEISDFGIVISELYHSFQIRIRKSEFRNSVIPKSKIRIPKSIKSEIKNPNSEFLSVSEYISKSHLCSYKLFVKTLVYFFSEEVYIYIHHISAEIKTYIPDFFCDIVS